MNQRGEKTGDSLKLLLLGRLEQEGIGRSRSIDNTGRAIAFYLARRRILTLIKSPRIRRYLKDSTRQLRNPTP